MSQRSDSGPQRSVKSVSLAAGRKILHGVSQHMCVHLNLLKTHREGLLQHPQPPCSDIPWSSFSQQLSKVFIAIVRISYPICHQHGKPAASPLF